MIIAIANQKGGVAKTTTAVNLAHGAAIRGQRVLLIDLDTQGNISDSLGVEPGNDLEELVLGINADISKIAYPSNRPSLSLIRSDKRTALLKMHLTAMDFREGVLAAALDGYQEWYDLVLIDCAPSADVLHVAALVASDWVIIPAKMEQFAIKGIGDLLSSLASVNKATRSNCRLAGIVPTFYDWATTESHLQMTNLTSHANLRPYIWPVIPTDTHCREAHRLGKTLWEILPKPAALIGRADGSLRIGGYQQVLDKVLGLK